MELEIGGGGRMPVAKGALEVAVERAGHEQPAEGPGGRPVADPVVEQRAAIGARLEQMVVLPEREGAADLDVAEAGPGAHPAVLGDPAEAKRPLRHAQDDPAAVLDALRATDDLDPLPGRRQPGERTRSGMPGEQLPGGGLDRGLAVEMEIVWHIIVQNMLSLWSGASASQQLWR